MPAVGPLGGIVGVRCNACWTVAKDGDHGGLIQDISCDMRYACHVLLGDLINISLADMHINLKLICYVVF